MRPMGKAKPDVLDALMSAPADEGEEFEGEMGDEPDVAVIDVEDEEPVEPEDGTPEAAFAKLRSGLDELEQMFRKG